MNDTHSLTNQKDSRKDRIHPMTAGIVGATAGVAAGIATAALVHKPTRQKIKKAIDRTAKSTAELTDKAGKFVNEAKTALENAPMPITDDKPQNKS
jgi:hypothetical protein